MKEPDRITCPASGWTSNSWSLFASHATALIGLPITAAATPLCSTVPLIDRLAPIRLMSMSVSRAGRPPRTTRPHAAASEMLSTSGFGPATLLASVDDLDARQHEVRGPDHVDGVDARPDERLPQHEGQLDLDQRPVHPAARHDATLEHEPVVEHRPVVGLAGVEQLAHRLRREPDLVALDDPPRLDLELGHGHRDPVGVRHVGVGIGLRDRRDRLVVELGAIERGGGRGDLLVGQHVAGR